MHIILKDPETGTVVGVLCIERHAHSCHVLEGVVDRLEDLVAIARANKVPQILLTIPKGGVEELESYGWRCSDDLVVMVKDA